jgi:Zn-dependent protease with chaperone function
MPGKARPAKFKRRRFPGLEGNTFQHPADVEAMRKLERLPIIPKLVRRISSTYTERMFRMLNVASRVRVSPHQCPRVYEMFREACDVLDVKEVPEIYISTEYSVNAFSFGIEKYAVVLKTGLMDLLTEEELLFVIGHEVSHIKSNHMLYRSLLYLLTFLGVQIFGTIFKLATITFLPLEMMLRSWERKAEFTADRGGLLVVQKPEVVETSLVKLAGASRTLLASIDIQEILKQADDLQDMDEALFVRAMRVYHNAFRSHPFPVIRIKELHNWSQSDQYRKIMAGNYTKG